MLTVPLSWKLLLTFFAAFVRGIKFARVVVYSSELFCNTIEIIDIC